MSSTDHHFMNQVLYSYDIYPKVFLGNRKQSITIQPLGLHAAFEVLGGESIYSRNGFQTGFYYEMKTKGIDHPVVESTDSHGSTEHNKKVLVGLPTIKQVG